VGGAGTRREDRVERMGTRSGGPEDKLGPEKKPATIERHGKRDYARRERPTGVLEQGGGVNSSEVK